MGRTLAVLGCLVLAQIVVSSDGLARALVESEKQVIADAIGDRLQNPESAEFKWLDFIVGGESLYCALVRSKNSSGDYSGFVPFEVLVFLADDKIAQASPLKIGTVDPNSAETVSAIKSCKFAGYDIP